MSKDNEQSKYIMYVKFQFASKTGKIIFDKDTQKYLDTLKLPRAYFCMPNIGVFEEKEAVKIVKKHPNLIVLETFFIFVDNYYSYHDISYVVIIAKDKIEAKEIVHEKLSLPIKKSNPKTYKDGKAKCNKG